MQLISRMCVAAVLLQVVGYSKGRDIGKHARRLTSHSGRRAELQLLTLCCVRQDPLSDLQLSASNTCMHSDPSVSIPTGEYEMQL